MEKLKIVLLNPKFIGLLMLEKTSKIVLSVLLAIIVSIAPAVIKQNSVDDISTTMKSFIEESLNNVEFTNAIIVDYKLNTDKTYEVNSDFFTLIIGEGKFLSTLPIIQFNETNVNISLSGMDFYTVSYEELNLEELDFSDINSINIKEQVKFYGVFNKLYQENKSYILFAYGSYLFFDMVLYVFVAALIIAVLTSLFNKNPENEIPFKLRYKIVLNCTFIYLLFVLFSLLYSLAFLQIIGNILMVYYATVSTKIIIVKKGKVE